MNTILHRINRGPLDQGLRLLPAKMDSLKARAQLLKIGLQESLLTHRQQLIGGRPIGPAAGLWQFELGGISGLLRHSMTRPHMEHLCKHYGLPLESLMIWRKIRQDDELAAAVARLNLWWHSAPMPDIDDEEASWQYYLFCWRPGAAKRDYENLRQKWGRNHNQVLEYLRDPA